MTQIFVSDCRFLCREYITTKLSSEKARLVGTKTLNVRHTYPYVMPVVAKLCRPGVKEQCYVNGQLHNVSMLSWEQYM
jgi:hypothetical protein